MLGSSSWFAFRVFLKFHNIFSHFWTNFHDDWQCVFWFCTVLRRGDTAVTQFRYFFFSNYFPHSVAVINNFYEQTQSNLTYIHAYFRISYYNFFYFYLRLRVRWITIPKLAFKQARLICHNLLITFFRFKNDKLLLTSKTSRACIIFEMRFTKWTDGNNKVIKPY